jgi:hypothetical protein
MRDHIREAEALFRDFAERHSLAIERFDEPNVELLMRVPRQPGLSFELMLGLQDGDVLNIGFERFWSHIFPFEQKRDLVAGLLDGVVTGECRLAIHRQFGFAVRRVLERRTNNAWEPVYNALGFGIPFVKTSVSYVCNEPPRAS